VLQIKNGDHVYEMLPGVFRSERPHDVVVASTIFIRFQTGTVA